MARRMGKSGDNAEGETTSGYFRRILKEDPKLLRKGKNQELLNRWLKDHPDQKEVPDNVKAILHNLKSVLRKKRRQRRAEKNQPVSAAPSVTPSSPRKSGRVLEQLEERIDECLAIARSADREGLAHVIELLRSARNEVVRQAGA